MTRMQRFWSWLAVELGKRAGLVAVVGLLITVVLGYGATRLTFSTGQDSYLNADDQVYIDNVEYQRLFGGEAMLIMYTAAPGTNFVDMMSSGNMAAFDEISAQIKSHPELIDNVVTPKTALEWDDNLVASPNGDPTGSVAGQAILAATQAAPTPEQAALRQADALKTLQRLQAIPPDQQNLNSRAYVDFLIHDNEGKIRSALAAVFTDETHA